ncbi:hypothetical protein T12_9813 [Trichinella patagoniensis]|uniref:Uncharacterized protein n=1 Tax=Trichinella patagoniensis TaxID=990121 RepID=A0A0V0ZXL7_9BILA|nr:hypothetical protein T12_9813 [Trichinella patagoniensis]
MMKFQFKLVVMTAMPVYVLHRRGENELGGGICWTQPSIKFGRRTIVAYDVEEDYQKNDRHTVTVVGAESAIAEHNFSSIRK